MTTCSEANSNCCTLGRIFCDANVNSPSVNFINRLGTVHQETSQCLIHVDDVPAIAEVLFNCWLSNVEDEIARKSHDYLRRYLCLVSTSPDG